MQAYNARPYLHPPLPTSHPHNCTLPFTPGALTHLDVEDLFGKGAETLRDQRNEAGHVFLQRLARHRGPVLDRLRPSHRRCMVGVGGGRVVGNRRVCVLERRAPVILKIFQPPPQKKTTKYTTQLPGQKKTTPS